MPTAKFLGKRLLFVTAHPDDESYAVAGTILKNCQCSGQSFLICATFGEKGKANFKKKISGAAIKQIRQTELKKVCKYLGVAKLLTLNFPDTKLNKYQIELKKKLELITANLKFDFVLSFGKDGISGHTDHLAIGRVARQISSQANVPFIEFCAPPSFYQYMNQIKRRRKFGKYVKRMTEAKPNLKIKINPQKKWEALAMHKSQLDVTNPFKHIPSNVIQDLLNYEYFKF